MHLVDGYGSTEAGAVFLDGQVRRPPVIDYKLVDVPDLGYFRTDRPHPRGELLVKTDDHVPRLLQATGSHRRRVRRRTATTAPATSWPSSAPISCMYLDRRNNVLKLSQGEFVTVSKLEAVFGDSPLVRQIYIYGNSARSYLLAVIVPDRRGAGAATTISRRSKPLIGESLQDVAKAAGLQSYEIPRDFIIETTPFTLENGLLTGIRKLARPKLKEHYGHRLEQLYTELAEGQADELRALRHSGADRAGAGDRQSGPRGAAGHVGHRSGSPTPISPIWAEIRCRR